MRAGELPIIEVIALRLKQRSQVTIRDNHVRPVVREGHRALEHALKETDLKTEPDREFRTARDRSRHALVFNVARTGGPE